MYLHSDRTGGLGSFDIWVSRRATVSAPWGKPTAAKALNSTAYDADPFVRADGRMIVFASARSREHSDIFKATIDEAGTIATPTAISEVNTTASETNPVLSANGLALYFTRAGATKDIFVARRKTVADRFGTPTRVEELATGKDEYPSWVSADECLLYLTVESTLKKELFVAERPR
jgi:Tol biopolymer transport system component